MKRIYTRYLIYIVSGIIAFVSSPNVFALSEDLSRELLTEVNEFVESEDLTEESSATEIVEALSMPEIDSAELYKTLQKFGTGLFYSGKQALAVKYYRLLMSFIDNADNKNSEDTAFLLNTYVCLGASLEELGLRNIAMEYYMQGIEIAGDGDYKQYQAMLLNNIGVIYLHIGAEEKALKYFTDAIAINEALENSKELFINYNNLAAIYAAENKFAQALDCTLKSLHYVDDKSDPGNYYSTHINLGILNAKEKRYPISFSYLNNAVNNLKQLGFSQALIEANIALSDVYSQTQMLDSAVYYNKEALRLARDVGNSYWECSALEQSSRIAANNKQWELSNELLSKSYAIKDSIRDADNRQRIEQWESIYNFRLLEPENRSIISQWNPENIFYAMLGIIAILLCVIVILQMMKARKDKMLKINAQAHIENQKQHDAIQNTIDLRNRELTTYTLEKFKTNEFINDVSEELRELLRKVSPKDRECRNHIQLILKKLMQFGDQDSWKEFQYYFEKVHPHFYEALDDKVADLTPKERRLCAFLYLDLSTKEIASITFREVRSVEASRNRLRKKLNVPHDANLSDYIKSIIKK